MDLLEKTKAVLKSLVISSPKRLTIQQLGNDYFEREGQSIPFNKLGYSSLRKFLCSMPDTLKVNLHTDVVSPVLTNNGSQHIYKLVCEQQPPKCNRSRSHRHQGRAHKKNVDCSFSNFNDDHLRKRMQRLELKSSKGPQIIEAIPVLNIDSQYSIPQNVDIGTKIPNAPTSDFKPRHSYNIFISEINRPWRFWFHLSDKPDVETMVDELGWYYQDSRNLTMNKSHMIVGDACVVFYVNKWLRAEFIEQPLNDTVKVCLVDYGTIVIVNVSLCRYILNYFCSIPKCCYVGALEFIDPINNRDMELKLVQNFCKMANDKPLVGVVIKVDMKNDVVRLVAINTSDEDKDLIINKELLDVYKGSE